jgi:hypothetical protein
MVSVGAIRGRASVTVPVAAVAARASLVAFWVAFFAFLADSPLGPLYCDGYWQKKGQWPGLSYRPQNLV